MKLHWLLSGTVVTIFMLSSPSRAATLESWRFDSSQNRLEINTDTGVQPQAQLVFNPTRLVIDLPGVKFERRQVIQPASGAYRSLRVGQFNQEMSRIVVELAPGYTIDPKQVKFESKSANRWVVQLPEPQIDRNSSPVATNSATNIYNSVVLEQDKKPDSSITTGNIAQGATQIENIQITGDGFFVRTSGGNPLIRVSRSRDRQTVNIDIASSSISANFLQRDVSVNRFGVNRVIFSQLDGKTPIVRMSLQVDKDSPDWRVSKSSGGLVVLPNRLGSISKGDSGNNNPNPPIPSPNQPFPGIPAPERTDSPATIQSVELGGGGTQLIIRADRKLTATSGWDRTSGMFRITIPNARLTANVRGPSLNSGSPLLRIRLQEQQESGSVIVMLQPAAGVQIGQLNQITGQFLALELNRYRSIPPLNPPLGLPPFPQPNPGSIGNPPNPNPTPIPPPRRNDGRLVVIIDPGHGGKDPGAPGIGGTQEKNIILPIGIRVAQILQQNGVQAVMTRNADYFVTLQGRVDMAERANADVFVSIHANSAGASRPDVNGLETYYYDSGLGLARIVHNNILQSLNIRDRGVRRARFYVLRKSSMPSILVETGYMTGQEDIARLQTPQYQAQMADAIARGILQYLRQR
ncbi:N-acetylmuramoyl-L-alanine amidase [Calothrix sp. UHCC 0171]|uniref:N-acetylmuramoyl-L-alanine amidase n=1 Tax=Calothrix sp. UHCC 0171 TaxID=3110245 RepID=UPI002B21DAC4|nr:N-acetylmuramoyl-L-alanine amidase [Calothrix sp. UHCC 0171]MEA5571849.1 N-acetylmuramoyl-L-alanine amidase [Calothrix sp. UHCC 0171]